MPNENGNHGIAGIEEKLEETRSAPQQRQVNFADLMTRRKQRAKHSIQQNRFVIIAAAALIVGIVLFVMVSMPHRPSSDKKGQSSVSKLGFQKTAVANSSEQSLLP